MPAGENAIYCQKGNRIRANPGGGANSDARLRRDIQENIRCPQNPAKAV